MPDNLDFKPRSKNPTLNPSGTFDGIPLGSIKMSDEVTARAERAGEVLGFRAQLSHSTLPQRVGRRRTAVPSKSIFLKGPEDLIDWFIQYTDAGEFRSYWEALADLKNRAGL
jgi:hypothetical protein